MNKQRLKSILLAIGTFVASLLLSLIFATPSHSHWADLAVAEIAVSEMETQVNLTFPTGLVAFADRNQDGQLSAEEVRSESASLEKFLSERIQIADSEDRQGILTVRPLETAAIPSLQIPASTHSTLLLSYSWSQPVEGLQIKYDLFVPDVATASCQATILYQGRMQTFVFTPKNKVFSLGDGGSAWLGARNLLWAIAGSFVWGAMHSMSPGHGKTIVGAYLVGSRATFKHALFLAMTTTIAHTAGVFALGLVTLFASRGIVTDELYPWLNLLSGVIVVVIGVNLCRHRIREAWPKFRKTASPRASTTVDLLSRGSWQRTFAVEPSGVNAHSVHHHHHEHHHHHHHGAGAHSHLPPGADGSPVTWKSLLALGLSSGLLPCPSALVLLLSATALGSIGFGLTLVLSFSLGLALVLTAIGFSLVYARGFFDRLPQQIGVVKCLPAVSAAIVVVLGVVIAGRSAMQIWPSGFN
ncbi:nickel/cobalt transporter [Oscillatoria sp. HE19RPO]|uniref:nickel/cobalt transporter n=1 Tax=Oscillatoria sp. HE19RPO TaxID=2954806 RepID=UPI0020C45041|nr:sulfite exporter TauE/SafE family protein [Oscillatoria sp. HE19RPO]